MLQHASQMASVVAAVETGDASAVKRALAAATDDNDIADGLVAAAKRNDLPMVQLFTQSRHLLLASDWTHAAAVVTNKEVQNHLFKMSRNYKSWEGNVPMSQVIANLKEENPAYKEFLEILTGRIDPISSLDDTSLTLLLPPKAQLKQAGEMPFAFLLPGKVAKDHFDFNNVQNNFEDTPVVILTPKNMPRLLLFENTTKETEGVKTFNYISYTQVVQLYSGDFATVYQLFNEK